MLSAAALSATRISPTLSKRRAAMRADCSACKGGLGEDGGHWARRPSSNNLLVRFAA